MAKKKYYKRKSGRWRKELTAFGETKSFARWAEHPLAIKNNLTYGDLMNRICTHGWPPEKALTTPIRGAYGVYNTKHSGGSSAK